MNRSAKRLARLARFAITLACTATLTILIIRGRDPTFLNFHKRSPAEIALSRVIKRVNFQRVPFYQAIGTLSRAANIKIEFDNNDIYSNNASLTAEQITLGDTLRELLVSASGEQLHCFSEGDRVRIGNNGSGAGPAYVDEYLLPGVAARPDIRSQVGLFIGGSPTFALPHLYDYSTTDALDLLPFRTDDGGMSGSVGVVWPPRLLALMPASSHQEARQIFEALRLGATPAARRKLPFGTEVLDFVRGAFHSRDARTAHNALHSVLPVVAIPRQPLDRALNVLGAQVGLRISLTEYLADLVSPDVELEAKQITLASVLRNLVGQNISWRIDFEPEGGIIYVCPASTSELFRVYDLRRAFEDRSEEESADLMQRLRAAVPRREKLAFNREHEAFLGSMLVVRGTWSELEGYEKSLLECLRSFDSNRIATHP